MRTLIIGSYLSRDLIEKYNKISNPNSKVSFASIKYSDLISKGFKENLSDSDHLFMPPIGSYPYCRKLLWTTCEHQGTRYIPFINIILLKQISICIYVFLYILNWAIRNRSQEKVVIFTYLYLPFLFTIIPFSIFSKIKFASFVPDLPTYEFSYSDNDGWLKRMLIPVYIYISNKLLKVIDFFIFITKYMTEVFPQKPFHIMEGLTDIIKDKNCVEKHDKKAIMYSGALFEKFGVDLLIKAFIQIKGDYELWLFGSGDMVEKIKDLSNNDKRIKYYGIVSNEEVLEYQRRALLLVNPRFSDAEFTKYSFPSKLIEYLSSGTPVLTTKLPGIPDDYNDKFFYFSDESINGFIDSITSVLRMDKSFLHNFGIRGREYALNEKNYKTQISYVIRSMKEQLNVKD